MKKPGYAPSISDPIIKCPNCQTAIKLTESLAAPLVASMREQFEQQLQDKDNEISKREQSLQSRTAELNLKEKTMEEKVSLKVAERLEAEKKLLIEAEAERAKLAVAHELGEKNRALMEMQELLNARDAKLKEAQKSQADYIKQKRELEDAKRELDLEVQKRVSDELTDIRLKARKEAEELLSLKIAEKEQTISSMQKKIQELQQKADQTSQQLQGEVLELELEELLRTKFAFDSIEPVPKGEHGGDIIHRVCTQNGQPCGIILWESKRTKSWNSAWLTKLRSDQRDLKADIAVIETQALPEGIDSFGFVDGVWVCSRKTVEPVAFMLRHVLTEVNSARQISDGVKTKAELVYQYLTGPRFKQRVEAIVEAFSTMKDDLDKEKKAIMRQWSKREGQIENVMAATVGMWGDLQGIAGSSIQEIEGMNIEALGE